MPARTSTWILLGSACFVAPALAQQGTAEPVRRKAEAQDPPGTPPDEERAQKAEPVVVTAPPTSDYVRSTASSATRTSTPIAETPASIQVVPQEVISDQASWRLKDVYRNVSSVQPVKTEGFAVTFEDAFVRGFQQRPYLDGARTFALGPVDLQALERVEVLKGPASILYGAIEPGGVINLVPKTPQFEAAYSVSGMIGSYDFYRGAFDATGPIDQDRTLAYRVTGSFQDSESFRDSLNDESVFLAPSLAWHPTENTRVTAWTWYQNLSRPVDDGVAFSNAGNPIAPIDTFLGDPNRNTQDVEDLFVGLKIEHDFTDDVTLRQEVLYHDFDAEMDAVRRFGGTSASNTVSPFYDASRFSSWDGTLRTELIGRAETGGIEHEILGGVQIFHREYEFERRRDTMTIGSVPIVDPVFPRYDYVINNTADPAEQNVTFTGFYLQDHAKLLEDRLHVLAGVRLDHIDQNNDPGDSQEDVGFTWRAGALYEATTWMSPYANVSTSFNPTRPGTSTSSGETLDPETGTQYEAGLKFALFDDSLTVTTAAYQIEKEDVAVADPLDPNFSVNAGELRSRGFEFDALGRIADGLQVIASYAYTDTEVVRSSSLPEGEPFRGIPLHSGSLWLKYDFLEGSRVEGLGIGAGVFGASEKAGDDANTFRLAGFARLDMAAWYNFPIRGRSRARFQVNVMNVTDEEYYESSFNVARVQPGQPLSVFAQMKIDF